MRVKFSKKGKKCFLKVDLSEDYGTHFGQFVMCLTHARICYVNVLTIWTQLSYYDVPFSLLQKITYLLSFYICLFYKRKKLHIIF